MQEELHGYRLLKTGDLSFLYKQGAVRRICVGDIQVVNAIYGAVRDRNWGTVPFQLTKENIHKEGTAIQLDIELHYEERNIQFEAEIRIRANPRKLSFHYRGKAINPFLRNRIGICVLHPVKECRGQTMSIIHPDGSTSETSFPAEISPDQPVLNMTGMRWKASGLLDAELHFRGEVFEMEDQRNWTDASYKSYGTPLELPFPVQVHAGDEIEQSVQLKISATPGAPKPVKAQGIKLRVEPIRSFPLPLIGVGSASDSDPVTPQEAVLLKQIPFHHIRADLRPGDPAWLQKFARILAEQEVLGWPVELGIHFRKHHLEEIRSFLQQQGQKALKLESVLLFNRAHLTDSAIIEQVLPVFREAFPEIPVGGGTNAYFAELNRSSLEPDDLDFISYSICPQVHAFDKLSLLENLEAQGDSVYSAKMRFQKPVHIGAMTLKQRFNIVATDENEEPSPYPLADHRQGTVFTAGWTMGSIRRLAKAGVRSLNVFETVGPRGLIDRKSKLYPVYYVLEELLKEKKRILELSCSDPLKVEALALQNDHETTLLLVNLTGTEQQVELMITETKAVNSFILAERAWMEIPSPGRKAFHLKAASMYKLIWRS